MRQLIPLVRANEKKLAWLFLGMILSQYAFSIYPELSKPETYEDYSMYLVPFYERCSLDRFEHFEANNNGFYRNFLKSWLNCFGHQAFGNDRILPALFSIGCVYLVYALGHSMSKDRIVGLIAAGSMIFNPLLTNFDTSPTYDQAWAFFFLLSMVLLYRLPLVSPFVYPLAIFSKIYAVGFIPMYLYTAYREQRHFKFALASTLILGAIGGIMITYAGIGTPLGFHPERIGEAGLRIFEVLWAVLPALMLVFGLDMIFKGQYNHNRNTVLLWLVWIMITIPIIYLISDQWMFGYRFVPFAAFLGIYMGMTVAKVGESILTLKLRKRIDIQKQS